MDFTAPAITQNYSTGYTASIIQNQKDLSKFLDSAIVSTFTGIDAYAKRYNSSSDLFEQRNAGNTAWEEMPLAYAKLAGATFSGAVDDNAALVANSMSVGASAVWHAGNFTPGNYQPLLGYTPINKAGDTMTGTHNFAALQVNGNNVYHAGSFNINNYATLSSPSFTGTVTLGGTGGTGHVATLGNDMRIQDIDLANTIALYGNSDVSVANLKLGSSGPTLAGLSTGCLRLTHPTSGTGSSNYTLSLRQGSAQNYGKILQLATDGNLGSNGTDGPQIHMLREGAGEWGVGMVNNSVDFGLFYGGSTGGWGTLRFRFDSAGNFTLKGNNPTITVSDEDGNTGYIHVNTSTFYILRGGNNADYGGWSAVGSGSWPLQINLTNNDATFGGNLTAVYNVTAYSDERKKRDFAPARVSLDQMLALEPESFVRIDSVDGLRQVGVRAQALRKVLPETVLADADGFLSANYGAAATVLVLNLAREVAALRDKVAA